MPPTFDAGLRKPNSLIGQAVCPVFTRVASLRSITDHAGLVYQLQGSIVEGLIDFWVSQFKHENRVTDLRVGRSVTQKRAESLETKPLERANSPGPNTRAVV